MILIKLSKIYQNQHKENSITCDIIENYNLPVYTEKFDDSINKYKELYQS